MNFLDSINVGLEKADSAEASINEVTAIFTEVNLELSNFPQAVLSLNKGVSLHSSLTNISNFGNPKVEYATKEYFDTDKIVLNIAFRDSRPAQNVDVAKWKQHINGYPCTLSYEGEEFRCYSADDLRSAFNGLFSSVSFGKAINKIIKA